MPTATIQNTREAMRNLVKNDMEWSSYFLFNVVGSTTSGPPPNRYWPYFHLGVNRSLRRVRTSGEEREYSDFFNSSIRFFSSDGGTGLIIATSEDLWKVNFHKIRTLSIPFAQSRPAQLHKLQMRLPQCLIYVLIDIPLLISDFIQ